MKLTLAVALSLAGGALAAGGCNANNCARGVTGTRVGKKPDVTSRYEDCVSFQLTTVTPAVSTSTATVTIYTDSPPAPVDPDFGPAVPAATVIPSNVPDYASSCNGPEGFASACSCWGATATATTVATPVVTVTATQYIGTGCKYPLACPIPVLNQWNCGNGKKCTCLNGVDNQKLCVQNASCFTAKECTKHSDCAADEGCVKDTCCGVLARKGRICLKYAPGKCPNTLFPRDIFQKRADEAPEEPEIGCTAFGCPDEEIIEDQMRR